ncbi:MAG: copper amine oxidase N-terminal domain-containing protein [Firmicutes bacterium]|nr:copper amine oxidase N-terminal domain-containing protein [Bacillota bacterium]
MKKFFAGIICGIILATAVSVYAESSGTIDVIFGRVKLAVNGKMTDTPTLLYNGRTYIQLRGAADAFGATLDWDEGTNTATLTYSPLIVSLDNASPSKNEVVNLLVSGAKYTGRAYKAAVFYKTTSTAYDGTVGEPCAIKVGPATPDWPVQIVVTLESGEQAVASFTPRE